MTVKVLNVTVQCIVHGLLKKILGMYQSNLDSDSQHGGQ